MAQGLAQIGDTWSLLILREISYGRRRFSDFVDRTGAQRTVVSARLKQLVEHGILTREAYSEHPVRHHYSLTDKGRALLPVLVLLTEWGAEWADDGDQSGVIFHHESCGHDLDAALACRHCDEVVELDELSARFVRP